MAGAVRVEGLAELHRALKGVSRDLSRKMDRELLAVGRIVASDAASRFSRISERTAAGFRPRARGFGTVFVQQTLRKTTGKRPDYGRLQMREALWPAVDAKEPEVLDHIEDLLDRVTSAHGFWD